MSNNLILLIIDPGLNSPCIEAINCVSKIFSELKKCKDFKFDHFEYVSPFINKIKLRNFVYNKNIGACICLGSIANVTDQLECVSELSQDIENIIFKKNIPFFGICFSHQMYANMAGFKVNFLKARHKVYRRKHYAFRKLNILHPKLSLLATKLESKDYFSDNYIDLNFKSFVKLTSSWDKKQWNALASSRHWTLTAIESRLKKYIEDFTSKSIICHARHEQEVLERNIFALTDVEHAATSDQCHVESLIHLCKPIYTIQTHPETNHELNGGYLLIKNFIYLSSLICD